MAVAVPEESASSSNTREEEVKPSTHAMVIVYSSHENIFLKFLFYSYTSVSHLHPNSFQHHKPQSVLPQGGHLHEPLDGLDELGRAAVTLSSHHTVLTKEFQLEPPLAGSYLLVQSTQLQQSVPAAEVGKGKTPVISWQLR